MKNISNIPDLYPQLEAKCREIGFTMPSDILIGPLLKSLVASKKGGDILELGTGIGLSLAWMVAGLDSGARITSIDNDQELISIARSFFSGDERITLVCADGSEWISNNQEARFDLVFADAWPGKYSDLEEILGMITPGGFYVIDDMNPQPNWPEGHHEKAMQLLKVLDGRSDLAVSKIDWSTGVVICTKL